MRNRQLRVRAAPRPLQPRLHRAARLGDHAVAVLVLLDGVERDDVPRMLVRLAEVEIADDGFDLPRVVDAALGPDVAEPHRVRPRKPAVFWRVAGSEGE